MNADTVTTWLPTLALVLMRVAGIFLVAPVFGHAAVPVRLRYFLSVVTALAVVARTAEPVALPASWFGLAAALGAEAALGAAIGYAARLVFVGVELGALHIGQQIGLDIAGVLDAGAGATDGGVRRLFRLLAIVIFLAVGGHRMLVAAVLRTFRTVPLAGFSPDENLPAMVTALLGAAFLLALKVAAPVLIALLLTTAALGLLQRSLPQCNILSVGLSVRVLVGLGVLAVSLAAAGELFEALLTHTMKEISTVTAGN